MLSQGSPMNPGKSLYLFGIWARFRPTQIEPGLWGKRAFPTRSEATLKPKSPATKGNRRWQPRAGEISYEPIVPTKVENRRAPARGGHGIHWREGGNRWTYRHGDTSPRRRTRSGLSNATEWINRTSPGG